MASLTKKNLQKLYRKVQSKFCFPFDLKGEQSDALLHLLNGENVVVVAPTGFGKSNIFTLFPLLLDIYRPMDCGKHVAIVISPLTALIEDQLMNIKQKNVPVAALKSPSELSEKEMKDIEEGFFSVLLVTPESLLDVKHWREIILNSPTYEQRTCLIALDEAHVIAKWGKTFRSAYNALDEIRACLVQSQMLFLTATLTKQDLQDCLASLQTDIHHVKVVAKVPDRPNIFLGYKCEKDMEILEEMDWYINRMRNETIWAPKCIIYVSNLNTAGQLYSELMYELREDAYFGKPSVATRMIVEYHGESMGKDQMRIIKTFSSPESSIRLVIATVAFGMGINIPDINYVVHWGPPPTLLEYWQEVGRAGRDGSEAFGLFYAVKQMISSASNDVRQLVKQLNSGEVSCIRQHILSILKLCDTDETYIQELAARQICYTTDTCREMDYCKCPLCSCCTPCWNLCQCDLKVYSSEKLSTTNRKSIISEMST